MYLCLIALFFSCFISACSFKQPENLDAASFTSATEERLPASCAKIEYEGGAFSVSSLSLNVKEGRYETESFLVYDSSRLSSDLVLKLRIPQYISEKITDIHATAMRKGSSVDFKAEVKQVQSQTDTSVSVVVHDFKMAYSDLDWREVMQLNIDFSYGLTENRTKFALKLKAPASPKTIAPSLERAHYASIDMNDGNRIIAVGVYDLFSDDDLDIILPVRIKGHLLGHFYTDGYGDNVPGHSLSFGDWRSNDCSPTATHAEFLAMKAAEFFILPVESSERDIYAAYMTNSRSKYSVHIEDRAKRTFVLYAIVTPYFNPSERLGICNAREIEVISACQRTTCNNYQVPSSCTRDEGGLMCSGFRASETDSRFCTSWNFNISERSLKSETTTMTGYAFRLSNSKKLIAASMAGKTIDEGIGAEIQPEDLFQGTVAGWVNFQSPITDQLPPSCDFSI